MLSAVSPATFFTPQTTPSDTSQGNALRPHSLNQSAGGRGIEHSKVADPSGPNGPDSTKAAGHREPGRIASGGLTPEEQAVVAKLRQTDRQVRAHEQAHLAAAGGLARGVSFTYVTGPDGQRYAVGGEVRHCAVLERIAPRDTSLSCPTNTTGMFAGPLGRSTFTPPKSSFIDTSPVGGDPEATIRKAQQVRAAANAPANPSSQDRQVAAQAGQMEQAARVELAQQEREKLEQRTRASQAQSFDPQDSSNIGSILSLLA